MTEDSFARTVLLQVEARIHDLMPEILAKRHSITWKPDDSPVTDADLLVEREVSALLHTLLPQLLMVAEESYMPGSDREPTAHPWIAVLDPIDGTENFCSGLREWGVSLSLWRHGQHAASMLLLPELGARIMSGDRVPRFASRIRGLSSSLTPAVIADHAGGEFRIMGCAVYNLYNVVRGSFQRFTNPKGACSWDILAGLMLAREQGCTVEVEGKPYDGGYLQGSGKYRIDLFN